MRIPFPEPAPVPAADPVSLMLRPVTPHAPTAGGDTYVIATVTGGAKPQETARRPLNLALVLDRSGSMSGDKLALVKNAALHLVHQLDARDRVAVVVYDDTVDVLIPSMPVTPDALPTLSMALAAVQTGGSTNLEGGWRAGVQQVAARIGRMPGALHRVLLLTDGLANVGITETGPLSSLAKGTASLGVVTSTFGVGTDYDEQLLAAMAEAGGGNDYFIPNKEGIHPTFQAELAELLSVVAEGVSVTINFPQGAAVKLLNPNIESKAAAGHVMVPVGFVSAEESRDLVFRVTLPRMDVGTDCAHTATATWTLPAPGGMTAATLPWAAANDPGTPDPAVLTAVAAQEAANARWEAYRAEKTGDYAGAARGMRRAAAGIAAYAPAMAAPMSDALLAEADEMQGGSSPVQRKRMHNMSRRVARGKEAEPPQS